MGTLTYVDRGAVWRNESGSAVSGADYVDRGAAQRPEAAGISVSPGLGSVAVQGLAPTIHVYANQSVGPSSDISSGGWTPSTGTDLFAMLDEVSEDDSDYIYSPNNPTTEEFEVKFPPLSDPMVDYGHNISVGLRALGLTTAFDMKLVQGTTVLDSWTEIVAVSDGYVTRHHVLGSTVANNISDYSDLRVRGVARAP